MQAAGQHDAAPVGIPARVWRLAQMCGDTHRYSRQQCLRQALIALGQARRRRRSNPPRLNLNTMLARSVEFGGGSAIGTALNVLMLNRIQNVWARNASRLGVAVVGSAMLRQMARSPHLAGAPRAPRSTRCGRS